MDIRPMGNVSVGNKPAIEGAMVPQAVQNKVSEQTAVQTVKAVPQAAEMEKMGTARKPADRADIQSQIPVARQAKKPEASVRLTLSQAAKDSQELMPSEEGQMVMAEKELDQAKQAETARQENAPRSEEAEKQAEKERAQKAVDEISESLASMRTNLSLSVDEDLGRVVVKIMDPETDEVIKQIPSEEALELAKSLGKMRGIFIKTKV